MKSELKYIGIRIRNNVISIRELDYKDLHYGIINHWSDWMLIENPSIEINRKEVVINGTQIFSEWCGDLLWVDCLKINNKYGKLKCINSDIEERKKWGITRQYLKNGRYEYLLKTPYKLTSNLPYKICNQKHY